MDLTAASQHLRRIQERFDASLTPEQRKWYMELAAAASDRRQWWEEQFEDEAVRHLPGLAAMVRMFFQHLRENQRIDLLGKCCRSPEEISEEWVRANR